MRIPVPRSSSHSLGGGAQGRPVAVSPMSYLHPTNETPAGRGSASTTSVTGSPPFTATIAYVITSSVRTICGLSLTL